MMEILNLDNIVPDDIQVKWRGKTIIVPGDATVEYQFKTMKYIKRINENNMDVEAAELLKNALYELLKPKNEWLTQEEFDKLGFRQYLKLSQVINDSYLSPGEEKKTSS